MSLPSQIPTLSCNSRSSSIYSDDESASDVNSTGTQVHRRSHLIPSFDCMPRDKGQLFERVPDLSPPEEQGDSVTDLCNINTSKDQYRFETPAEATMRQLEGRSHVCADGSTEEPRKRLNIWTNSVQRNPAQGTVQEVKETGLSLSSQSYNDSTTPRTSRELGFFNSGSLKGHPRTQPVPTLQSRPASLGMHSMRDVESIMTADEFLNISFEGLSSTKPHGSANPRDGLLNGQPVEANVSSIIVRTYGHGDPTRGYISGDYVTEIGQPEIFRREKRKKRDIVRALFRLRR